MTRERWPLVLALFAALTVRGHCAVASSSPTAVLGSDAAEFFFPVAGIESEWSWSGAGVPADSLEYGWTVEFRLGDTYYRVSAQRFKLDTAAPGRGTFEDLSVRLQTDVWRSQDGEIYVLEPFGVPARAYAESGGLLIRVEGGRFLERLREMSPRTVTLRSEGAGLERVVSEVPLTVGMNTPRRDGRGNSERNPNSRP